MSRPLSAEDFPALAQFRYLLRCFLRFSKDYLARNGRLSPEQYEALLALRACTEKEGMTIGGLSERLQVKHHTAVNLIDGLVGRKLITRRTAEQDRRHKFIKLTSRGRAMIERLAAVHRKEIRRRAGDLIATLKRLQKQ